MLGRVLRARVRFWVCLRIEVVVEVEEEEVEVWLSVSLLRGLA